MSDYKVALLQHKNDFDPGGPWVKTHYDFAWYFPYASLVHAHAFVTVTGLVISIKTAVRVQLGRSGHGGYEIEGELDALADSDFAGFLRPKGEAPMVKAKCQGHLSIKFLRSQDGVHDLSVFNCFPSGDNPDKVAKQDDYACNGSLLMHEQPEWSRVRIPCSASRQLPHDWLAVANKNWIRHVGMCNVKPADGVSNGGLGDLDGLFTIGVEI